MWRGIAAYVLAVGCEIPFISQQFYTGPLVSSLGGVDISWFVGAIVAFVLYMIALRIPVATEATAPPPESTVAADVGTLAE